MNGVFFEDFHKASKDFPYFDPCMKNINYLPHFHDEIEVISVRSGEVEIIGESGTFLAKAGDIAIFMPCEIHSFLSKNENHIYVMKIYTKNSIEKTDFSTFRILQNLAPFGNSLNSALLPLIDKIAEEISSKSFGYAYTVNGLSNMMLGEILRSESIKKIDTSLSKRHLSALSLLENVNFYIENHYKEPITLKAVSSFCNFSEYYFAHFFKESTGLTFMDFLTAYRLEKALQLLRYSRKNVTETAFECGFSNSRAFNRAFKKQFGTTPTEYLKANTSS